MKKEEEEKFKQLYFSHDIFADKDEKILKMFYFFRKNITDFTDDFIKRNFYLACYGLYWQIVQYMHRNELKVDDVFMLADELRVDVDFVKFVLNDFDLFRIEDGLYISDRIIRNIEEQQAKAKSGKNAANTRWLLASFNKSYKDIFGEEPILESEEIEALKKYNDKIEDFKKKIPDILFTLKNLKFDTDINFKPCANWLLAKNNLSRLLNGEFGVLKHKKTNKELKAEAEKQKQIEEEKRKKAEADSRDDLEIESENISGKYDAIQFLVNLVNKPMLNKSKKIIYMHPCCATLQKRFDITDNEIRECITENE